MAYGATYTQPYYEGAGASALVPHQFDCSLNGRPFMFDTKYLDSDNFGNKSIKLLKTQVDDSAEVSDRSLNPEEFAKRSVESWHHGAGQAWLDRLDSDPYRFRSSKGVAVFTRNELSMLPDTDQKRATAATNPFVLPVGGFLYAADGQQLYHTADITVDSPAWTDAVIHVGEAATTVQSITTDGFYAYAALGVNGIHRTERGTGVSSHWSDLQSSMVAFVKDRLMAVGNGANKHILYNVTAAGAAPAALYTHRNTDWNWAGFAGMANHIIAAGYSGDKCVDETTEVLTRRGWLTHEELRVGDEALTIDPDTSAITWQPVQHVNRSRWDGPLERWTSERMDALTTPNHRWIVGYRGKHQGYYVDEGPYSFLTTEQLHDKYIRLVVGGGIPQAFADFPTFADELVELIGWVVTEGTYPKATPRQTGVYITQSPEVNPGHCERLRRLVKYFSQQGATATEYEYMKSSRANTFYFGKGIGALLRELAPNRQLTPEFLTALTTDQARLLYETLIDGDGHRNPKTGMVSWMQKDTGRIDGFQMLASMLGKRTHAMAPWQAHAAKQVTEYRTRYISNHSGKKTPEEYHGIVWCPTTPTGTWLARRNGFTYWTGNSILYRIGIQPDGTALTTPVVAGELPDGEIVRSVEGYLGQYLLIGTDKGFRLAVADTNGNLTLATPVEIGVAVRCFEPQGAQVWFGWSNYDAVSTGLGRMDLRYRTDDPPGTVPVPAYASDLMVTAQGNVISVATFQNIRVFGIAGSGVWAETTTKVPTGTIDSGFITFGLGDRKVMMYADVRHAPLVGSVNTDLSVDGGAFVAVGSNTTADTTGFVLGTGERVGDRFELRLTPARSATAPTTGPTVTRHSLEANPAPGRGRYFTVPLLLWPTVVTRAGTESQRDIEADYLALLDMEASGLPITYVDATGSHVVFLEDDQWVQTEVTPPDFPPGTLIVRLKKPRQR